MATYTYSEAVEQTITAGEQIHQIVNGTATTEVTVEDGSKVPSIRKALVDNFYFKDPIPWQVGQTEIVFNQLRQFTDGSWWYAPSATATNPVNMGSTPVGNSRWQPYEAGGKLRDYILNTTTATFKNELGYSAVENMIAGRIKGVAGVVEHKFGNIYSTGAGVWRCLIDGASSGVSNFTPLTRPTLRDFGGVGDGVTDDSLAKNSMIAAMGYLLIPEGTFIVDRVGCDGVVVGIYGTDRGKSILKSRHGVNTHTVEISNNGGVIIRNVTIDQNESAQTGGHGIRSAGCSILGISNATIKNCKSYGIGLQAGTAKGVKIDNVLIDNTGSDGIDVKDYNFDNDVIQINNLTVTNYGRANSNQTAVDIRGPVNLTNLVAISTYPDTRAFRLRSGNVQGRPGSGTASNIYFKGQDGSSYAVQISNDVKDYAIHGVVAEGCGLIAIFGDGSEGYVTGLVGRNLLTEGCSIFSTGLTIDGLIVSGVASRAVDFEPTSRNNRITNFKFSGVGSADFVRIHSGSQNNQMVNGMVEYGKTPSVFAGTNATIQNVTNFKTLYKGISDNILVDSVATKTFVFTHGLGSTSGITPDLSSIRTQVVAATSGGQKAELGPVFINAITPTQIEIVLNVITPSPTAGAAVKVAIEASKYNGHP